MRYKILFVDDETANLRLLERLFRDEYDIYTAASAAEALELLSMHDVGLIVSDQRMPSMTGSEFLKEAAEMRPQTVRIMLTGYTDVNDLVDAINSGVVYKYITKPWVNEDLKQTVKRALQHYETTKAQRQLQLQSERLRTQMRTNRDGFVEIILAMMERLVPHSRSHAERTASLVALIGTRMELDGDERDALGVAARLHDALLFDAPDEIAQIHTSVADGTSETLDAALEQGLALFGSVPDLSPSADLLRFRYERFDGLGHPAGFSGEQIPLGSRILAVADAYDKLMHFRPDRGGTEPEGVVRALMYDAGKMFDPEVVGVLCDVSTEAGVVEEFEVVNRN